MEPRDVLGWLFVAVRENMPDGADPPTKREMALAIFNLRAEMVKGIIREIMKMRSGA
jgi:hypothetical protein